MEGKFAILAIFSIWMLGVLKPLNFLSAFMARRRGLNYCYGGLEWLWRARSLKFKKVVVAGSSGCGGPASSQQISSKHF